MSENTKWKIWDEGADKIIYGAKADAARAAHEFACEGVEDLVEELGKTVYGEARYAPVDDPNAVEIVEVRVDPDPPACVDGGEHEWDSPAEIVGGIPENPGCWGHGGGIVIEEVCMRCACGRTRDTWDQSVRGDGEPAESVQYVPEKYSGKIAS